MLPSYKANDSSDMDLIELISPLREFKNNLAPGRMKLASQQRFQVPGYMLLPSTSGATTSRNKMVQTKHKRPGHRDVTHEPLQLRPTTAPVLQKDFNDGEKKVARFRPGVLIPKIVLNRMMAIKLQEHMLHSKKGYSSHQKPLKSRKDGDKATELRLISKAWHQECESSISIQQRLMHHLNSKYKKAFANGRMYTYEKCKYDDFKAEVGQLLTRMETAGAPQMPGLRVRYELAVECVDEVFGNGMGKEYMRLEMYYLEPALHSLTTPRMKRTRSVNHMKEAVAHQYQYVDVQNVVGYMLDQLSLTGWGSRKSALQ